MMMREGRPCCPLCDGAPTEWGMRGPMWGHFCASAGSHIYWTTDVWSPHKSLIQLLAETAHQIMIP